AGAAVAAGNPGRPPAADDQLANDVVTGRGRWLQGRLSRRLSRSPLLLKLKEHLPEGDGIVGIEPPGGDSAAVDAGPIGTAQIPDLDSIGSHDQLGVAPGDRRIVDGDVAGYAPSN